ncbi:hypothetical protein NM208_g6059 [Fusarium decemcellulare]|uniref:Uncharacterized protein n=1 Tax=Fusarium decemcellulare TaxID=57161 RepID=A0ACC1SES7_9HYPO|nr:hypothetical protein NM208_g6059 [Fusarium decemcellulare]
MSFGYFAASSTTTRGPSPSVTFLTSTSSVVPTPIIPSPSSIIKAIDDIEHCLAQLKEWPETAAHFSDYALFAGDDHAYDGAAKFHDAWVLLSNDLEHLEKELHRAFAPIDRDVSLLLKELRGHTGHQTLAT